MFVVGSWYNVYRHTLSKPLTCSGASQSAAGVPCGVRGSTAGGLAAVHMSVPEPMAAGERRAEVQGEEGQTAAEAAGRGVLHTRHGASGAE
jgi:hypothetical protein